MINKSFLRIFIVGGYIMLNLSSAFAANVSTSSTLQTSCPGALVNGVMYFTGAATTLNVSPSDSFWTPTPAFILNANTDIVLWSGNNGSINCGGTGTWYRASNYSIGGNVPVNAFYNNSCVLSRSNDPTVPFAQIVFRIGYKYQTGFASPEVTVPNQYFYYNPTSPVQNFIADQRTRTWGTVQQHPNECLNYYARWCGDGIVSNGEACDPADAAHTGWGVGGCDASCQPIAVNPNLDLRIKKYAKSEDIFASVSNTEDFNYNIVVENHGTGSTSGLTTVVDVLPSPVALRATPTGNGWTCTGNAGSTSYTCTSNDVVTGGQVYSVITIPVRITNLAYQTGGYINTAFVQNPNEAAGKRCFADNHMPTGNETQCTEDVFNADPAGVNPPNPNGYDLRLKKYVNNDDTSTRGLPGNAVTYTFVLQNLGAQSSSGVVTVTDNDFTGGITIASIAATQGEWSCTQNSGTGFTCTTSHVYAAGEYGSTITVVANIPAAIPVGQYRNVACLSNAGDPDETAAYNPDLGQYKNNNCDPALVVIDPLNSFDLMLKKYVADTTSGAPVNNGDHQTATIGADVNQNALTASQSGTLQYRFTVTNLGYVTATGTTTVEDTLPNGISVTNASGTGWVCTTSGASFICTRSDTLIIGASFPDIVVNAQISPTASAGFYTNMATLRNPNDVNVTNNTDPANVRVVVGPSCGAITANQGTTTVAPNTAITYTCSAAGFTGSVANLEYNIACAPGDSSAVWSGSATRVCNAPAGNSASQTVSCGVRDSTNPSVIFTGSFVGSCSIGVTTSGGGGGGAAYVGKKCVNSIPTCATYSSLTACTADGIPSSLCYSADAYGFSACQNQLLSCGGGGGGGGGASCGNGVLEAGEECDIRGGSAWCVDCKLITTNPGANPIDTWIAIPTLANTILGKSSSTVEMPFTQNSVVVGNGTKIFTLADIVRFGMHQAYTIPLMIEYDKPICLESSGDALNSKRICTTFGQAAEQLNASAVQIWVHPMTGAKYVILSRGDFQYQKTVGGQYFLTQANSSNSINLFKGSAIYGGVTLHDTFIGQTAGTNGQMNLGTSNAGTYYNFLSFPVRVSAAVLGTTGTPVNRSIQAFVYQSSLQAFLSSIKNNTTTSVTTSASSSSSVAPVNINTATTGNRTVTNIEDIPTLNGNQSVRIVKNGNLTINCPAGKTTLEMTGVRTIIVENGNLILNCNTVYPSGDTTSSFAWIVKGGNIQVLNGQGTLSDGAVTNLAGVYVAIQDGSTGGNITYSGNNTTQKILKIEGSLYGNATPLFSSRLYARGTSAYDILTTGTIISYSNRALVSPPPLLSQYLNNYDVQRVVK